MTSPLLKNINKYIRLNEEEINLFNAFWTEKTLKKGELLIRNGEVCKTDNFVVSGALKAFYINAETGKEEILFFAIDDWWANDIESFQKQKPTMCNIQALQKSVILQITHDAFQNMLFEIPKLERYFRIILENHIGATQRRLISLKSCDAQSRYLHFINSCPQMAERIPNYLIASYLGFSSEYLSRLRKKIHLLN